MSIFRQYIAPLLIVMVFLVAMIAVSARAFLPGDMAAPAPIEDVDSLSKSSQAGLSMLQSPVLQSPGLQSPVAQFFVGQFHMGQFYIGQFCMGQFYIGQFYIQ